MVVRNPDLLSDNLLVHKERVLDSELVPIGVTRGSNLHMPSKKLLEGCLLGPLRRPYRHLIGKLHR
jgi:hypothetical protein